MLRKYEKVVAFCLLILASELSGQNFQHAYASANEDPDLLNMVLLSSGNLIAAGAYASLRKPTTNPIYPNQK